MGAASALTDNAGEVVLCPLELVDGRGQRTVKQSVAVIKPRGDDSAGDCLRHLVRQQTTHVTKGAGVIVNGKIAPRLWTGSSEGVVARGRVAMVVWRSSSAM